MSASTRSFARDAAAVVLAALTALEGDAASGADEAAKAPALPFPNLTDGDRLTGVNMPGVGARFYHNDMLIGEVAEPEFAQAFFGIWLDPETSRPDFRKRLLGE